MSRNLLQELAYGLTTNITASTGPAMDPRDIIADLKRLIETMPPRRADPFALSSIFDMKINIEPRPRPRMQVSESFARIQSPELVASTNKWMAERFGYEEPLTPNGVVYCIAEEFMHMNPVTYKHLAAHLVMLS